jgi:hypothetical protein
MQSLFTDMSHRTQSNIALLRQPHYSNRPQDQPEISYSSDVSALHDKHTQL